jgi:Pectate lyase superfamily protein
MASPLTAVKFHSTKADGTDNAAGKVYTYAAGTTTPQVTYTTPAAGTPNANPVILDATGRASIYLDPALSYKFVCQDSLGASVPDGTVDNWVDPGDTLRADLADTSSVSKGDALIGVKFNAAGGSARTQHAKNAESVSLTDFGAVGDGVANCGAALQAAHDALPGVGGTIYVPACSAYYLFTTGVVFTKYIRLIGAGVATSTFYTTTASLFMIQSSAKLDIENQSLLAYGAARTTAVLVKHLSTSAGHNGSQFSNCTFDGGVVCYQSQRTNSVYFDNCRIGPGNAGIGLLLENLINSDEGDSFFSNNTFSGAAGSISVNVPSTAGLYFSNNKFNGAASGHILINCTTHNVGDNIFTGNSIEGHTDYGINIVGTTGVSTKNLITGNQFSSGCNNHVVLGLGAQNNTVTGNTFNSTSSATGNGVLVQAGSIRTTITGNAFHQILTAITCATGTGLGITASGNRFAEDVTTMFVGDDTNSVYPPQREISLTRLMSVTSSVTYSDAIKFKGNGVIEIRIFGNVSGVGDFSYHRRCLIVGSTLTDIDAAVNAGAVIDVQAAAAAGYMVISVRRNAGGGGVTLSANVEVTARGQIIDFKKA